MKKTVKVFIIGCLFLVGCAQNKEVINDSTTYPIFSYITEDMEKVQNEIGVQMDVIPKTPKEWCDSSEYVVLATVISLDKAENVFEGHKDTTAFTFGRMLVQETYKGSSLNGSVVEYAKLGGIITMAQYDEGSHPNALEKRKKIREESGQTMDLNQVYVNTTWENDIMLEAGKTYLFALRTQDTIEGYQIIGLADIIRESNLNKVQNVKSMEIDKKDIELKNNETGEFEPLTSLLDEMGIS